MTINCFYLKYKISNNFIYLRISSFHLSSHMYTFCILFIDIKEELLISSEPISSEDGLFQNIFTFFTV